jgi:predicted PhzF superfamily epimerase YddE/YHI9
MADIDVKKLSVEIDEKKLSINFSQERDLDAMTAKVLAFLKHDVADSGTVTCVIREAGEAGGIVQRIYRLGLGQAEAEVVEASAGEIAAYLIEYAESKDGKVYSDATLEIHHP